MTRTTTVDATTKLASLQGEIDSLDRTINNLVDRAGVEGIDAPADRDVDADADDEDDYVTIEERHDAKVNEKENLEGERDEFVEALIEWTSIDKLVAKCDDADDAANTLRQVDTSPEFDAFDAVRGAKDQGDHVFDAVVDACIAAGDGVFEIKRLTWGETNEAADRTAEVSYDYDSRGNVQGMPKEGVYKTITVNLAVVDAPDGSPSDAKDFPYAVGGWLYDKVNAWNTRGESDMGNSYLRDKLE